MTTKRRIQRLEKTSAANVGKPGKVIVMYDADGDGLAEFDGMKMTQAEAEQKAASLPDSVLIIHVIYEDVQT